MKGLYNKYIVTKANGKPLDPNFYAIVVRIDGGQYVDACRKGVLAFAKAVEPLNPELAFDIDLEIVGYIAKENKFGRLVEKAEESPKGSFMNP